MQVNALLSFVLWKGEHPSNLDSLHANASCRMKLFPNTINRESKTYKIKHYRAHWQPLWAYLGLVLCVLLAITSGWGAVYDLSAKTEGVTKEDSIVDLTTTYLGVSHTISTKVEEILLTHLKASFFR